MEAQSLLALVMLQVRLAPLEIGEENNFHRIEKKKALHRFQFHYLLANSKQSLRVLSMACETRQGESLTCPREVLKQTTTDVNSREGS